MESREIVRRAIESDCPPRLPFWQHWNHKMPGFPDDVCNIWEMDRAEAGWFFDKAAPDDWGCGWEATEVKNMGQVTAHLLASWSDLDCYRPPDPRNPFYYERLGPLIDSAGVRYVAITAHNLLFSRLHKLRGFAATMEDFYLEPERVGRVLDMIVDFKVRQCEELHRRFGDRIHGLFVADDWGTPQGGLIAFDYGAWEAVGVRPEMPYIMFDEFVRHSRASIAPVSQSNRRSNKADPCS